MAEKKQKPITIEAPRTLSQEPMYNLETTIRSQFSEVVLLDEAGQQVALVVGPDRKKQTKIGSANSTYLCGLILGVLGSRGDAPGGAALWAAQNAKKMAHLSKYVLKAVPKKRGGTLEAPISVWMKAASGRAELIGMSIEKYPIPKRTRDTKTGDGEEEIEVWL